MSTGYYHHEMYLKVADTPYFGTEELLLNGRYSTETGSRTIFYHHEMLESDGGRHAIFKHGGIAS